MLIYIGGSLNHIVIVTHVVLAYVCSQYLVLLLPRSYYLDTDSLLFYLTILTQTTNSSWLAIVLFDHIDTDYKLILSLSSLTLIYLPTYMYFQGLVTQSLLHMTLWTFITDTHCDIWPCRPASARSSQWDMSADTVRTGAVRPGPETGAAHWCTPSNHWPHHSPHSRGDTGSAWLQPQHHTPSSHTL